MMKLAPEWVQTSDPVIRSPACYRWTTAPPLNILTDGHDVSRVADSPIHRTSGVPDGGGVALYYEGELSDSEIMKEILGMTGVMQWIWWISPRG